jgi:hypothetical protein
MEYIRGALSLLVDMTIEQLVITLLLVVVYSMYKKVVCIQHKYNQLDKLVYAHALIIAIKLKVRTVKTHRTSDYELEQPINHVSGD